MAGLGEVGRRGARRRRGIGVRLLRLCGLLLVLAFLGIGGGLAWAHWAIRGENPPLPDVSAVRALAEGGDRPLRLSWFNTASQRGPFDDAGAGGKRLAHPVFVLEWADGRVLLVDTGMDAEYARRFGRPLELILGADPVEPGRSVADALGPARRRLAALVFTHLHVDHTEGIGLLCPPGAAPFTVFMSATQLNRPNYTTRGGLTQVRAASCARAVTLPDAGLAPLQGFPGVGVFRVAGHTPGSQIVVAWVGTPQRGYVLAGDVVFEMEQIREDRPKALAYRLLVTPENDEQLGLARRWLRDLETEHGITVIPSHDQGHLESLGLERFETPAG